MAIGDLFMLSFHQTYGSAGKACDTVWSYRALDAAANASELSAAFVAVGSIVDRMNAAQTTLIKNVSVRTINLFSLTDFDERAVAGTGDAGSDTMPRFNAYKYTLRLNTRGINPGRKSIRGVSEGAATNGVVDEAGFLTTLEALRVEIGNKLAVLGTDYFEPVVIGRILMPPDVDHDAEWYRLPANVGESNYGSVVSVQFNPAVGHQVTGE